MAAPQDSAAAGLIIESGEESPSRAARVKRVSWFMTSVLLMADVMGTGVLSLPSAASSIGWVLTCFSLVVFALCATYSGILLSNVRNDFFPSATSYAEVAALTGGAAFGTFTKMAILVNWGALLPYFLISLSESIALIDPRLCQWQSSLIGLALLLLPCQARTMHYISFLAVPSTLAILVSVACALATLENLHAPTTAGPAPDQGFLQVYSAFSSFIFAYQGQSIFLEFMREMRDSTAFPRSATCAYLIMMLVYALTALTAYGLQGRAVSGFLPASMPDGGLKQFVGVCLVFHVTIAYVVTQQPFVRFFHAWLFPATVDEESHRARLHWTCIYGSYLIFAYLVANAIPFFAVVQELIGALLGAPIVFGWPAAFFVAACRSQVDSWRALPEKMGWGHAALCALFLLVAFPLFTILGTIGAVEDAVDAIKASGAPFTCASS